MAERPREITPTDHLGPSAPGLDAKTWSAPAAELGDTDICIAGGGPAGLACAIAAALRGLRVQVVDGMTPPIDKACGEGLMPDTLAALAKLGVRMEDPHRSVIGHPFQGIRFLDSQPDPVQNSIAQACFPSSPGRGVSRLRLHQRLLDRATELGIGFHWQTVVKGIDEKGQGSGVTVHTSRGALRARFLIGADGHQSRVRTWAGLDRATLTGRRVGLRQHFVLAPWTNYVEVYWSAHGQAYVTPVSPDEVCVAFIARQKFPSVAAALTCFPQLHARLAAAPLSDAPRGSITLSRKLHRVTRGCIALLGDASGSVDAVTGEGLSLCFRQALALADALAVGDLAQYQRAHASQRRLPHLMAGLLLLLDRSPRLRARVFALFERQPHLFAHLLEVHVGESSLRLFGRSGLLATGLHLLSA